MFEVDVNGLTEISWWILGYGDQVTVLEPPELRQRVIGRLRDALHRYDEHAEETRTRRPEYLDANRPLRMSAAPSEKTNKAPS